MKQKNLLVLVGAPGSGKSTWAAKFAKEHKALHVSRDIIRYSMLEDNDEYFANEDVVFDTFCNYIKEGLRIDDFEYVIADATHLNQFGRNKLLSHITLTPDVKLIAVVFDTPLQTCLDRNAKRTGRSCVPESIVKRMWNSFTDPIHDQMQHFDEVWHINEEGEME